MDKAIFRLKRIVLLQKVILGYLALLLPVMVVTWVLPNKAVMIQILMPLFYGIFLVIPFALVVMAMSIQVFSTVAKFDKSLEKRAGIAGGLSVFTGVYILGSFVFADSINAWAMSQSHDLVVAAQSSPVVLGLTLLAVHVYFARYALVHLSKDPAS